MPPRPAGRGGKRPNGYLGLVDLSAPPAVKQLVESVNAQRKAKDTADRQAERHRGRRRRALAGAKLIERTPPGQYVMGVDVKWVKK